MSDAKEYERTKKGEIGLFPNMLARHIVKTDGCTYLFFILLLLEDTVSISDREPSPNLTFDELSPYDVSYNSEVTLRFCKTRKMFLNGFKN